MPLTREALLRRNPKFLCYARLLIETKAINGVAVLFYLHRGVGLDQVLYLSIAWSIVSIITEIPTGYLADKWGRKKLLILGAVLLASANVFALFAHGFWQFVIQFALMSAAFSCSSGIEEALLFDSLKELKEGTKMNFWNGRLASARQALKIFIPSFGAWLASGLHEWQFSLLICIDILGSVLSLVALSRVTEPEHTESVVGEEKNGLSVFFGALRTNPEVRRLAFNKIFVFIASFLLFRAYQPAFQQAALPGWVFPAFYVIFQSTITVAFLHLGKITKRLSSPLLIQGTALVTGLFLVIAALQPPKWILFIACLIGVCSASFRDPLFSALLNPHFESRHRAYALSHIGLLKALTDIPILLIAGAFARSGPTPLFWIGAALCFFSVFFLRPSPVFVDSSS